jgi:hypothetical protein
MTQNPEVGYLTPVPDPSPIPERPSGLRFEAALVRAALNWFDVMMGSGADLDRVTLSYVYGNRAAPAVLDLMDACQDIEHHRLKTA